MSASESECTPYETWLNRLFGETVRPNDYGGINVRNGSRISREDRLAMVISLFSEIGALTSRFGDAQVAIGLQNMLSATSSDELLLLLENDIDEDLRLRTVNSMKLVFRDCFLPHCTPHLMHLEEAGANPLNSICHMWWEYFPIGPAPELPTRQTLDARIIDVMKNCLRLPSAAVQEASLHGLGHWVPEYPSRIEPIIDDFIENEVAARPEIITYAKKARTGMIV